MRVNPELVMLWDGHSQDSDVKSSRVDRVYTDYSEEYILSEAEKVNYDYKNARKQEKNLDIGQKKDFELPNYHFHKMI